MIRLVPLNDRGQPKGSPHDFEAWPFSVGRSRKDDLHCAEDGVWDHHFQIDSQAPGVFQIQAGEDRMVWLNETSVEGVARLRDGDVIRLPGTAFQFLLRPVEQTAHPVATSLFWALWWILLVVEVTAMIALTPSP